MTRSERVPHISDFVADQLMIFHLFITYWNIVSRIGQEYTEESAFFLTNDLFDVLRHRREQNNWDIKEIEKICKGMDNLNETLNPNLFFWQRNRIY